MDVWGTSWTQSYGYGGDRLASQTNLFWDDSEGEWVTNDTTSFTHDTLGRMTDQAAGAKRFTYDLDDRVLSVTRTSGASEKLWYGPGGELLMRQEGQKVTWYLGSVATATAQLPAGCQAAGCAVDRATLTVDAHVLLGGARIASVRSRGAAVLQTLYYYRDRAGSVVATSLGGGVAGVKLRYTPYGVLDKVSGASGGDTQCRTSAACPELGYTGALRLTGDLVYLKTRVYDAGLRRFLTADGVDLERYTYVGGDPANYIDPSGMRRIDYGWRQSDGAGPGGDGTRNGWDQAGASDNLWATGLEEAEQKAETLALLMAWIEFKARLHNSIPPEEVEASAGGGVVPAAKAGKPTPAQLRERAAEVAESYVGDTTFAKATDRAGFGTRWKCNLFVWFVLTEAGIPAPTYPGGRWPLIANDWANPMKAIPGWVVVSEPQRGDVAAFPRARPDDSGHVGVFVGGYFRDVVGAGEFRVGYSTSHYFASWVVTRYLFTTATGPVVYRRYVGRGNAL